MHEGHRGRMRARYISQGAEGFAPHEIFEMLLFYTYSRKNTNPIAHKLLDAFSPAEVFEAEEKDLVRVEGIGKGTAEFLRFIGECINLYGNSKAKTDRRLKNMEETADFIMKNAVWGEKEAFYMLCLSINKNVLALQKICEGDISGNIIDVREVIKCALRSNAHSVVFAHNHKEKSLGVSQDDIDLNKRLREALSAIDVEVIDHIVISDNEFLSMAEKGFFVRV